MFAVLSQGKIVVRALPTMAVAKKVATQMGGKAIYDPRFIVSR